ncbi:response regulator [Acetobacterium wieringae]|uniref:Stage 0 sporulation protein A homolog n=1 Tax=Acetobacterium wieringae TaxID=52694 RepID=A0ABY6H9U6_9FIRM|nr:response regulator [Acetobacterium wieringae]UYO61255.1 response regulator [Acetobacterium wieringae]VUZ29079.1 Chemotaxis response regulator protein-glutamate methylesterase [Acetobacterium wieringae]
MITAILIDDEYYALEGLKQDLDDLGTVRVLGTYENGQEALSQVADLRPDLIFLDIEMPETNGLELFDQLLEAHPQAAIVFVSAYNQYAIQAFELNAMDYLLKPVLPERLEKTLKRLEKKLPPPIQKQLSLHCFGHFAIQVGGEEIVIPWRTKKAEELLAYLACLKGQFVAKEKLAGTLWPELSREKSQSNFYLTFHYLKKQLTEAGLELPIESERGKVRLNLKNLELDLACFEEKLPPTDQLSEKTAALAESAAALYRAPLLDGHYYEWSMAMGWRYEMTYQELTKKLAVYYQKRGDSHKAAYYQKASTRQE